jgi:Monooxygenase af470-like
MVASADRRRARGVAQRLAPHRESTRTGIWHETYLARAGEDEAVYSNRPPHGLGKAGRHVAISAKLARDLDVGIVLIHHRSSKNGSAAGFVRPSYGRERRWDWLPLDELNPQEGGRLPFGAP